MTDRYESSIDGGLPIHSKADALRREDALPDSISVEAFRDALSRDMLNEGGFTFLHRAFRTHFEGGQNPVVINTGFILLQYQYHPGDKTFMDGITILQGEPDDVFFRSFQAVAEKFDIDRAFEENQITKPDQSSAEEIGANERRDIREKLQRADLTFADIERLGDRVNGLHFETLKPGAGASIDSTSLQAIQLSESTGKPVVFKFSMKVLVASANSTPESIRALYFDQD